MHRLIAEADAEVLELGRENARSVVEGDGWKMIEAVVPDYAGPAPLATQLELMNDPRSDVAIGQALGGVCRQKVRRWRTRQVFCPLTGARLIAPRGVPPLCSFGKN